MIQAVIVYFRLVVCLLFFQATALPGPRREFHWDWHQSQYLRSSDPTLKDAKMAKSDRVALAKAIEAQIGPPDPRDPEMTTRDQISYAVQNAGLKIIRLRQDQKESAEVVVRLQNSCSPTGNCSLWFFERTPRAYRLLLDAIGQGFTVGKTTTNGFSDLTVNMHSSSTEQWLKVYRYAHGRYWRVAC